MDTESPARKAAVTGLAVFGFLALIVLGLWLAVWSIRSTSGNLSAAADYLGSLFTPNSSSQGPSLSVVPSASTTISFGAGTSTGAATSTNLATTTSPALAKAPSGASAPVHYRTEETTYSTPGSTPIPVTPTYTGLPDLSAVVTGVGYFDNNGALIVSPNATMSQSNTFGAEILVTNTGTNKTGPWEIMVSVPTTASANTSVTQTMSSLDPGQKTYIDMKLSGTPRLGSDTMTVTLDPNNSIAESNKSNNTALATYTVQ